MTIQSNSEAVLKGYIERVERLEEEKKTIAEDIKAVFAEARLTGFDTKAMKKVLAERKLDLADRRERRPIFDLYADKVDLYGDKAADPSEGLV